MSFSLNNSKSNNGINNTILVCCSKTPPILARGMLLIAIENDPNHDHAWYSS